MSKFTKYLEAVEKQNKQYRIDGSTITIKDNEYEHEASLYIDDNSSGIILATQSWNKKTKKKEDEHKETYYDYTPLFKALDSYLSTFHIVLSKKEIDTINKAIK